MGRIRTGAAAAGTLTIAPLLAVTRARRPRIRKRRCALVVLCALLFVWGVVLSSGDRQSHTIAQHHAAVWLFDLIAWEADNFPDKWLHLAYSWMPWTDTRESDRQAQFEQYQELLLELSEVRDELNRAASTASPDRVAISELQARLERLSAESAAVRDGVEEYLEGAISTQVAAQDLDAVGGMVWPPVDFRLDRSPSLLVLSPRDRIERIESHLIKPDIPPTESDAIEQAIQEDEDVSAIVVRTGGLGSYPAMVTASSDPLRLLEVAAHEWIHNYLFFKPLGINFFDSQEMTTLNETVADMAGRELGRMTYAALTGEEVEVLVPPRDVESNGQPPDDEFDFFRFMRETRLRTDELLAKGMIEEAERYMEERRIELQDHRIYIRKINQAYFAFAGSYGESGSSVSPVASQLWDLRMRSGSVGRFVKTVAGVSSPEEFNDLIENLPTAAQ